jgi:hypothetical protein
VSRIVKQWIALAQARVPLRASLAACAAATIALAVPEAQAQKKLTQEIVNGVSIPGVLAPVGLVFTATPGICTGTLIGCRTVLTAAHCVCPEGPASCATPPLVFFQHLGGVPVQSSLVHPEYVPQRVHDIAVLRLGAPAANVPTAPINQSARIPYGSTVTLVGFGRSGGDPTTDFSLGIKRAGLATTVPCNIDDPFSLCTNFSNPLGAPGEDSNTCQGDSGGPVIAGGTVAGVVSYGPSPSCFPFDHAVNADVFVDRLWIAAAAAGDLGTSCPGPLVGEPGVSVDVAEGHLSAGPPDLWSLEVPAGLGQLRVTLMAEASVNVDLQVSGPGGGACTSASPVFFPDLCTIANPSPGIWDLRVSPISGAGNYQLVATKIVSPSTSADCVPNAETACLQGGRFEVKVNWNNNSGAGTAKVMSFGGQRTENDDSVFYYFQSPTNFEMSVKMLNACIPLFGNKFWVFVSGLTNQGWQVNVRDTQTGATKTYSNTQGNLSETFADTTAFDC